MYICIYFFILEEIESIIRVNMSQLQPQQATAVIRNESPLVLVGDYTDPLAVSGWLSLLAD